MSVVYTAYIRNYQTDDYSYGLFNDYESALEYLRKYALNNSYARYQDLVKCKEPGEIKTVMEESVINENKNIDDTWIDILTTRFINDVTHPIIPIIPRIMNR